MDAVLVVSSSATGSVSPIGASQIAVLEFIVRFSLKVKTALYAKKLSLKQRYFRFMKPWLFTLLDGKI